ncbi:carboxylesterase family protein [Candidatus Bathyarchaeota archaeon]|nr:carboxylesterase family protein [Candidatus Bathyarchaeota archaeon]
MHLPSFSQKLFLGRQCGEAPILSSPRPRNESWDDTLTADAYGPACHFNASEGYLERIGIGQSADFHNINLIRPAGYEDQALPVVWIYGGGFAQEASVENGMLIMAVTLNYRLGIFGFSGGYQVATLGIANLGLKDQRMALRWVQENFAAFAANALFPTHPI